MSHGECVTERVRVQGCSMGSDHSANSASDQLRKRRARWRRNKRAERARRQPEPLLSSTEEFEARVWAERDRRRVTRPQCIWWHRSWTGGRASYSFQTDVWAVRTLLEKQHYPRGVTAGMVARRMAAIGLARGFKPSSLRTMVYPAYQAIVILEGTHEASVKEHSWPTFEEHS